MRLRRKGRCGVFAGNSVWSTPERLVEISGRVIPTIGAIQVHFLSFSFHEETLQQLGCIRSAWWSCVTKIRKRSGEPNVSQLLVPRCQVAEVLRHSHTGTVNGHFGIKRTLDQVQRRFYWSTWKSDTKRYCRHCEQCATYHRGKLRRDFWGQLSL